MLRTHTCGQLRATEVDQTVYVAGWVQSSRNLGGLMFIVLRDHSGLIQLVVDLAQEPKVAVIAEELHDEFVVRAHGRVRLRPVEMVNPAMPTGEIEVVVDDLEILSRSLPLPFSLAEDKVGQG